MEIFTQFSKYSYPVCQYHWIGFCGSFCLKFLPTTIGGDAVRIIGISQNINEKDAAVSSVFADRIFGLLCSVLLIPLSLPYITNKSASQFSGGTAFISSISAAFKKVVNFLKRLWLSLKKYFLSPRCIIYSLCLSCISFGFAILSFWILTSSLELQLTFWQIAQISVLSYFITLIPVSFNGLGLMEGSMIYLMTLHGADLQRCIAATVLLRFVMILTSLIGGIRLLFGWQGLLIKGNGKPAIN